ncbi:MAG: DUF4926 domain-containing protein [Archangium sp.]|nr:DUF4926 domain-containing protein [Archangium sp.]
MLTSNGHEDEGGHKGMMGYVIEVYGNGNYEVEFSDPATGVTRAQLVLSESELALAQERAGDGRA